MGPENNKMTKKVKIEAFPVLSGQNGRVHRVLRSILSRKRSGRPSRRRFDFIETSPGSLAFSIFFSEFWSFSGTAWHVLTTTKKVK